MDRHHLSGCDCVREQDRSTVPHMCFCVSPPSPGEHFLAERCWCSTASLCDITDGYG